MGNDDRIRKAFAFFDQNKNGYIEIEELRDALSDEVDTSSEEVITAIIQDVDTDKDGRINYEEFAAMMKYGTDWRKASREYSRERYNGKLQRLRKVILKKKNECIMRLSWALVHSRRPDDVQRGIAMLEALLTGTYSSPQQNSEKLYLLVVGYFRSRDYPRRRQLVERCLETYLTDSQGECSMIGRYRMYTADSVCPSRVHSMLASRACRSSVMIGVSLSRNEMQKILQILKGDHMSLEIVKRCSKSSYWRRYYEELFDAKDHHLATFQDSNLILFPVISVANEAGVLIAGRQN